MFPNDSTTQRRICYLPLPVWFVCQAAQLVVGVSRWVADKVGSAWRRQPTRDAVAAVHHRDGASAQVAVKLFEHLNTYRDEEGLRPLLWNERLEVSSLYQSERMSELGEFAHELSDGVTLTDRIKRAGYGYAACGENLFWIHDPRKGVAALAWAMHDGWVHSPGHQKNLVGDWTEVGIGVVPDGEGGFYATQNFGTPRQSLRAFVPSSPPTRPARRA